MLPFLGRGVQHPVTMEGAPKLKEISHIHAEAYLAGELEHGSLALVELRARGGQLYLFADSNSGVHEGPDVQVLEVAPTEDLIAPIVYTVPLQLLAYHVAVLKGTGIDHPGNLAKPVTVERRPGIPIPGQAPRSASPPERPALRAFPLYGAMNDRPAKGPVVPPPPAGV